MLNGLNNARIAEKLFISQSTVKTHVGRIYAKLGICSNRSELQKHVSGYLKIKHHQNIKTT